MPLTRHSGRAAVAKRLEQLGLTVSETVLNELFIRFKEVGDKKKFVYDDDLTVLVEGHVTNGPEILSLQYLHAETGTGQVPTATIRLHRQTGKPVPDVLQDAGIGDGPVDAVFKTIDRLAKVRGQLADYSLRAVSQGKDALGEVLVEVDFGTGQPVKGRAAHTDVIEASARAYLNAVNRFLANGNGKGRRKGE
jgi:2-isopropylmalate synthase